ncbi:Gag-like protein, partial [Operophtera brumata]
ALARRLTEELNAEQVRVSRPVTTTELRVSGIDDSVTVSEVAAAVARAGACEVATVTCGEVRPGRYGSCAAWVRCPVLNARAILVAGSLAVGWGSARVELLEARPLRCFKCLEPGRSVRGGSQRPMLSL